jgi:hypothetical protein
MQCICDTHFQPFDEEVCEVETSVRTCMTLVVVLAGTASEPFSNTGPRQVRFTAGDRIGVVDTESSSAYALSFTDGEWATHPFAEFVDIVDVHWASRTELIVTRNVAETLVLSLFSPLRMVNLLVVQDPENTLVTSVVKDPGFDAIAAAFVSKAVSVVTLFEVGQFGEILFERVLLRTTLAVVSIDYVNSSLYVLTNSTLYELPYDANSTSQEASRACILPMEGAYRIRTGSKLIYVQYPSLIAVVNLSSCEYTFRPIPFSASESTFAVTGIERHGQEMDVHYVRWDNTGIYPYRLETRCKHCVNLHGQPELPCIQCTPDADVSPRQHSHSCIPSNASVGAVHDLVLPEPSEENINPETSNHSQMVSTTTPLRENTSTTPPTTTESPTSPEPPTTSQTETPSSTPNPTPTTTTHVMTIEETSTTAPPTTPLPTPLAIDWEEIERRIARRRSAVQGKPADWNWRRALVIAVPVTMLIVTAVCTFLACFRGRRNGRLVKQRFVSADFIDSSELTEAGERKGSKSLDRPKQRAKDTHRRKKGERGKA